ncbi:MAG: DUF166 domain-containing protein [Methanosarcinaceae archaeon]|nr:DUF166 domain-containing protein [Methanosarcinaceae archaeon]
MTTIGVITRGKYGKRLIETILSQTDLKVVSADIPPLLPDFIEEPALFLEKLNLNKDVFNADTIITYSMHPDLTPGIARLAGKNGVRALIVPGGASRAPVSELDKISKQYGMYIEVDDICCTLKPNPTASEFTSKFGSPILDIKTHDGKVVDVNVIRGAPCGSTWKMAEKLIGTSVSDAPARAGLLIQQYPCRAVRGKLGGIHESALIHKKAVEKALISENNDINGD